MGETDVQILMASLDIRATSLTQWSIVKNQNFVVKVATCIGKGKSIDVETDTCYNNRNQTGYQAGIQSFSLVIDKTTGLNLPIAMVTGNILRPKICSLTYLINDLISSNNLQKIDDHNILTVNALTSDASAQISNVVKSVGLKKDTNINYFQCFVHKIQKKILKT